MDSAPIFSIQNRAGANSNPANAYVRKRALKLNSMTVDIVPTLWMDIQRKNPFLVRRNLLPEVTTLHDIFFQLFFCSDLIISFILAKKAHSFA